MAKISDFQDIDGKIDWAGYREAEIASGNRCYECDAYILNINLFGKKTEGRQKCHSCKCLENDLNESVYHESLVRCPHCRVTQLCPGDDNYELYADGPHDFWCNECDETFEVITHVKYEFESPKVVDVEEEVADIGR